MFERIALHEMIYCNHKAVISTVKIFDEYETIVMFLNDGEEIEIARSKTLDEAKEKHNDLVKKYNDIIYNGSISKNLGVENVGQFVNRMV